MDEATTSKARSDVLEVNLDAMGVLNVEGRRILSEASVPEVVQPVTGRDGADTYSWEADDGQRHWLGRTTMPSVRSVALVDTFRPGSGNVLLDGFGTGAEAALLLNRLAPHQAVMVVEESAWQAALVLRLHDFSQDLRAGRLLVFPGPDRWKALRGFLLTHPGYLSPDRVLAWPWYGPEQVSAVSEQLAEVATSVTRERAVRRTDTSARAEAGGGQGAGIAVVSNQADPNVIDLSLRIAAGASEIELPCVRGVLDNPGRVHPDAVRIALLAASPQAIVLIDALPDGLPYELPDCAKVVLWTRDTAPADDWVRRLPADARLAVMTQQVRDEATAEGLSAERVFTLPPAAVGVSSGAVPEVSNRPRVLIHARGGNADASAAGLHLGSHRRLWDSAGTLIGERVDSYSDEDAGEILRLAQRRLKIKLEDKEVERGLAERIRVLLGPVLVRRACIDVLREVGLEFDIFGGGWAGDEDVCARDRGRWPSPTELPLCLRDYGLAVFVEPSGCVTSQLLDCMAAGIPCVVRSHAKDATGSGLAAVLDPTQHISRFEDQGQLKEILWRFKSDPASFAAQATDAAGHVRAKHLWRHRVEAILEGSVDARAAQLPA